MLGCAGTNLNSCCVRGFRSQTVDGNEWLMSDVNTYHRCTDVLSIDLSPTEDKPATRLSDAANTAVRLLHGGLHTTIVEMQVNTVPPLVIYHTWPQSTLMVACLFLQADCSKDAVLVWNSYRSYSRSKQRLYTLALSVHPAEDPLPNMYRFKVVIHDQGKATITVPTALVSKAAGVVATRLEGPIVDGLSSSNSRVCPVCAAKASEKCSACAAVYYCSSSCQMKDWKRHKPLCQQMAPAKLLADKMSHLVL